MGNDVTAHIPGPSARRTSRTIVNDPKLPWLAQGPDVVSVVGRLRTHSVMCWSKNGRRLASKGRPGLCFRQLKGRRFRSLERYPPPGRCSSTGGSRTEVQWSIAWICRCYFTYVVSYCPSWVLLLLGSFYCSQVGSTDAICTRFRI